MIVDSDSPLIVALDYASAADALAMVDQLDPKLTRVKVGKELFTATGPHLIASLHERGFEVFLDLKFHDIPNTVMGAIKAAANLGVWMVNVHASGGIKMLEASSRALEGYDQPPLLIAVTVLTSLSEDALKEVGLQGVSEQVLRLATLAKECELDGVVCASSDTKDIKEELGEDFLTVTPGIRPFQSDLDDQSRVSTPEEAVKNGSDFLVIG